MKAGWIVLAVMLAAGMAMAKEGGTAKKPVKHKTPAYLLKAFDVNNDGKLDKEETDAMVKKYDKNGDGKLDKEEYAAMKAELNKVVPAPNVVPPPDAPPAK